MPYFEVKLSLALKFPFSAWYVDDYFRLINLPSLDVLISRSNENFRATVYQKPFPVNTSSRIFYSDSPCQKIVAFDNFLCRTVKICLSFMLLKIGLN